MMRLICSVCLMIGATATAAVAVTPSDNMASVGKGAKSTPVPQASLSAPAPKHDAPAATTFANAPTNGASVGKGAKGVPVPQASLSAQVPEHEAKSNSQPFLVINPRLPDPRDPGYGRRFNPVGQFSANDSRTNGVSNGRLARVTAYWPAEGDYYTRHGVAATGVRLHDGHCAVDPNIIPYGSVVDIAGVGKFLAVDTGTAVIERTAAREGGHTKAERNALVIDLFFASRREGEAFASSDAKWASISWWTPSSSAAQAKQARSMFADEDWQKIQNKL